MCDAATTIERSRVALVTLGVLSIPRALVIASLIILSAFRPSHAAPTNTLATSLAELAKATRKIPFRTVIEATTGHRVLAFDTNNAAHGALRSKILRAAQLAGERAASNGLTSVRANEAGNHLEPFVRAALVEAGLEARIPKTTAGRAQAAGYPDIEITGTVPCYIELKTYSATTVNTTQRSFYYSPSETPKVTRDALHLLLGFEMERRDNAGRTIFAPAHWKLVTLDSLEVDLKFEFNQSNRGLYGDRTATLDEGAIGRGAPTKPEPKARP